MNYINTQTLAQLTESEIRAANPNTSFSNPFIPPDVYAYVFPAPQPTVTATQIAREVTPMLTSKGHYEQQWEVVPKFTEYTDAEGVLHTVADQIAAQTEAARIAAIPASVSPRQIRQALTRAGLRAGIEATIATADQDTKDWYEFATEFQRTNQHVIDMGAALGVTELQLDDLWTLAGSL